jgi:hypothetical protein
VNQADERETAMVFGELYRNGAEWEFRAGGQGYATGLRGIATDFGVNIRSVPSFGFTVGCASRPAVRHGSAMLRDVILALRVHTGRGPHLKYPYHQISVRPQPPRRRRSRTCAG